MKPKHCIIATNTLYGSPAGAPFRVYDAGNKFNPTKFRTKIKAKYARFSKKELDPLVRFTFETLSKREYFENQWENTHGQGPQIQGHVFEAIVASHAIQKESCFHCKCRGSLRWQGGSTAPWTDMVCTECHSVFEIKSKEHTEAIAQGYNEGHGTIPGGSYHGFIALHKQNRKDGWKHFLVLVSCQESFLPISSLGPGLHCCWTVQISEIETVLPCLKVVSFDFTSSDRKMVLGSRIVLRKKPRLWFPVPYVRVDSGALYQDVLEDIFPGITTVSTGTEEEVTHPSSTRQQQQQQVVTRRRKQSPDKKVGKIRKELEALTVDDWEDLSL